MTETERIANVDTLQLIDVTPGWYIEKIPDDNLDYQYYSDIANGSIMIRSITLTTDPLLAEDFTKTQFPQREAGILASFIGAEVVEFGLTTIEQ